MDGQNKVWTIIMKRGGGKTPFVIGGDWERGVAKMWLEKGMSTLIIDTFPHPKYAHVPILHPDHYGKLSSHPNIYRTICSIKNMKKLFKQLKNVYNTLIVFEDCNKYIDNFFTEDQIELIGDTKQKNVDLMFMHWCWGWASTDLLRFTNYFVVGDTPDSPEVREIYIKGCYENLMEAHRKVKAGEEPYLIVDSGI